MKILLAVDNSKFARRSAKFLAEHVALLRDAPEVIVVNAHPKLPYTGRAAAVLGSKAIDAFYREECEAALAVVKKEFDKHGIEHQNVWIVGDPATVILDFAAQRKVDLIVMGSRGRTDFARLVMGSVSSKVVAGSKVPVLLVP
jgi:nucleotide-binding universal stress UspA family protein